MNLTDNEIIKTFEDAVICVGQAPFVEKVAKGEQLKSDIIDLINRQKAEIKALINGQDTLQKYIAEQKAEIERLNIRNKALTAITKNYDWKFAKAKSEAIKEFDKRFTKELYILQGFGDLVNAKKVRKLKDNLVKEMTE